jgi:hypothetical protein
MIPPSLAQKNSCGVAIANVSVFTFFSPAFLASAGNSLAELGFGIVAATSDVIFRVSAGLFEYTATQSRSVSMMQTHPPGFTTRFIP